MDEQRLYRTRIGRIGVYIIAYPGFILGFGVMIAPPAPLFWRLFAGVLIVLNSWSFRGAKRLGMRVSLNGEIVIRHSFYTDRLDWDDVDRLEVHRRGASMEVDLMLTDGRKVHSTLLQGRVVTWPDGKTKDILSVLQAELDARRSSVHPKAVGSATTGRQIDHR